MRTFVLITVHPLTREVQIIGAHTDMSVLDDRMHEYAKDNAIKYEYVREEYNSFGRYVQSVQLSGE